jgi:integrase
LTLSTARNALTPAISPFPSREVSWVEFLKARIVRDWRPGEFDFERLHFVPNPESPHTMMHYCSKAACGIRLNRGWECAPCRKDWLVAKAAGTEYEVWRAVPRVRLPRRIGCDVPGCARSHASKGFCRRHVHHFNRRIDRTLDAAQWAESALPALDFTPACLVPTCSATSDAKHGLCGIHTDSFLGARTERIRVGKSIIGVEKWVSLRFEPPLNGVSKTYGSASATPFFVLPEPLRWELLYAIQQRDLIGRARFDPVDVRGLYKSLRDDEVLSAVGLIGLGLPPRNSNIRGLITEWQDHIDSAEREWSGQDDRDPWIVYLRDLDLKPTVKGAPGARASVDLRDFRQRWIAESLRRWYRAAPRHYAEVYHVANSWKIVDQILTARGTPKSALGALDMDAVIARLRKEWGNSSRQSQGITSIERVMSFSRTDEILAPTWAEIPATFFVDRKRHHTRNTKLGGKEGDEDFRFIPQPIVDWMMDHLGHYTHRDDYGTAEARVMIFLQERAGRRTSETTNLRDDCISYDSAGHPYLKWDKGKPPYGPGKRIPIHQETHDVIRQWQQLKKEHGVESEWLFPSRAYKMADRTYANGYLASRVSDFAQFIAREHPFPGTAEDAHGNLIHFDITSVDPYAFRHAFAQRLADATDENGNSTTPPDVLQDYMGHANFNTTMGYYQVSARRKKRALQFIPPRRLNMMGQAVEIDRERDSYTRTPVTLGHCTEPHNVQRHGDGCVIDYACESCPFFLVDPLERDGLLAKREHMSLRLERAKVINSPSHILDHYVARIEDCTRIIQGIDIYVSELPFEERTRIEGALAAMADVRKRALAARSIDIRPLMRA